MTSPKAYDPPAELEGPDNGLVEAVAARIWATRGALFAKRATPRDFERQTDQVKRAWRWEIVDENGGAVALVMHHQDLQMLVAAPRMAASIRLLQAQLAGSPVLEHPAIQDLIASLPSPPTTPAKD